MPGYGTQGWKHHEEINWDKVSMGGGKVPPPGLYEAKVVKAVRKEASTGKPMISAQLELTGTDDSALREGVGARVYDNWILAEDGGFRLKNFASVAGILNDLPTTQAYDEWEEFCENVIGTTVAVAIKQDTYQGKASAKVDYYGAEPPSDDEERPSNGAGRRDRDERRSGGGGDKGKRRR